VLVYILYVEILRSKIKNVTLVVGSNIFLVFESFQNILSWPNQGL